MSFKQQGFSLVELMIAITLGLILMAGVVQMFLGSKQTFSSQQAVSHVQETGRLAIQFLSQDIRMASYYGCFRQNAFSGSLVTVKPDNNLASTGLQKNFGQGIVGYQSIANLPDSAATDLGNTVTPAANSNVLVLRSASTDSFIGASNSTANAVYASTSSPLSANSCVGDICANSIAVVSDCTSATVFKVSPAPSVAGGIATFPHVESWGGGVMPNGYNSLSEVALMKTVVYFTATGAGGRTGLFQKVNSDDATEVVEGVDALHFTYVLNLNYAGTLSYKDAQNMSASDWDYVAAVQIELLVSSDGANVLDTPQGYTFNGVIVPATDPSVQDRRIRKIFNATVGIRSRGG